MKIYKIQWEQVLPFREATKFYTGEEPNCKPQDVPEEFWHKTTREDSSPWQQYETLKLWAETGEQLIRKVQLFEMVIDAKWELVK